MKTKVLFFASILALLTLNVNSQNTFPAIGNVGIGTITPLFELDVIGDINIDANNAYKIGGENALQIRSGNVFVGNGVGAFTTGYENSFVGTASGYSNTTGNSNSFLGYKSGMSNTTGSENSFVGTASGYSNTTGSYNSFVGAGSGSGNTTGGYNSFLGYQSGSSNTIGSGNSFLGYKSGSSNTTGSGNSFVGSESGTHNTTGRYNSFLGAGSGNSNTTGYSNSFLGYKSGANNTTGSENSFVGTASGASNTTGSGNSFVGTASGANNTTGFYNSFLGYQSGYANTTGRYNSFLGYQSGYSNTTGYFNLFLGYRSGYDNTTGRYNLFLGNYSGYNNTTGNYNSFLGYSSGYNNTTGSRNVFLGYYAGYNETGSNKLYIENSSSATPLIYGEFDNNILRFNGDVGINAAPTGGYALYVNGTTYCTSGSWTASDKRYKKEIETIESALEKVKSMRGANYEFNTSKFKNKDFSEEKQYGFIAQELKEVLPELVKQDEDGFYAVNYDGVIPVLVEAIKELEKENSKIEKLEAEIAELKELLTTNSTQNGNNTTSLEGEAILYQNNPNPFSQQTEIQYFLSDKINNAAILIFDMNGKQLKSYELSSRGNSKLHINGGEFIAGMYIYSLIADGKIIDTKRMILN